MLGYCLLTLVILQTPSTESWSNFLDEPYSEKMFEAHMNALGMRPTKSFNDWYISGVYRARQGKSAPKWVVQVYDGNDSSFRFGCLVVLGPKGEHLRTIERERVHWSLIGTGGDYKHFSRLIIERIVVDLPDLNGDSYAELPTQRWESIVPGNETDESASIYQTKDNQIPCTFCVEFYRRWPAADLPYGHPYLHYDEKDKQTLKLSTRIYISNGNGFTRTDLPPRQLAAFHWSAEKKTWDGPQDGPNRIWKVLERK